MNIEIANRLVELRKKSGLSQEQLAEKIGVSRQAVSKWERSEASPDTDNIILLARIYGISLDELLRTDDEIPPPKAEKTEQNNDNAIENENYEHVGFDGIHVKNPNEEVHISWSGIHVTNNEDGDDVHVDWKGVHVNDDYYPHGSWCNSSDYPKYHHKDCPAQRFPFAILAICAYLTVSFLVLNAWAWSWVIFLTIPLYHGLVSAICHKNAAAFPYPVLITGIYCFCGIYYGVWHPTWVLFLTIPIYYGVISLFKRKKNHINAEEID